MQAKRTALMCAIREKNDEMVTTLLEHRAKVDIQDKVCIHTAGAEKKRERERGGVQRNTGHSYRLPHECHGGGGWTQG